MRFDGHFADGKTAIRHAVGVALTASGVMIQGAELPTQLWSYDDLRLIDSDGGEAAIRLGRRSDDGPRLVVDDPAFSAALRTYAPALATKPTGWWRLTALAVAAPAAVGAFALTLWFGLPLIARPVAALVPPAAEARLGQKVAATLVQSHEICDAPAGRAVLERLTARLSAAAANPAGLTVVVVKAPVVNAFAAPGGHVVIFAGLIDKAESPDEVAGVLAHEIGHVVHRHGLQALIRYFALSTVSTVVFGADFGIAAGAGQTLLHLAHSREAEAEADSAAVEILQNAGLRVDGLAAFFARIENENRRSNSLLRYASTHPPTGERRALVAQAGGDGQSAMSGAEWAALRSICD
jgi:Zn-dependent protease with chaperone function